MNVEGRYYEVRVRVLMTEMLYQHVGGVRYLAWMVRLVPISAVRQA